MLKNILILASLFLNQFWMGNKQENSEKRKCLESENSYSDNKTKVDLLGQTELLPELKKIINEYYQEWEFYKSIKIRPCPDDNPNFLSFSSDNKYLAYTHGMPSKSKVVIENIEQEEPLRTYNLSGCYAQIFFTNNENNLIIAEDGKNIKIIDINNSELLHSIKNEKDTIISVTITGNSKYLAVTNGKYQALIFETKNFESRSFNFSPDPSKKMRKSNNNLLFSPDGKLLAYSSGNGVLIGDVALNKTLYHIKDIFTEDLFSFSFDSKFLAAISDQSAIKIWNMENGNLVKVIDNDKFEPQKMDFSFCTILSLAFSPTKMIIATAHRNGIVKIWDPFTENLIQTIKVFDNMKSNEQAVSLRFSPNGKYLSYILRLSGQIVILKL